LRIFIGVIEISGVGRSLSRGFSALGHEAHLVTAVSHPYAYGGRTGRNGLLGAWRAVGDVGARSPNRAVALAAKIASRAAAFAVLLWAAFRYDAFIYLFGSTITKTRLELALLKFLKRKIIFVYMGSDVRPPYIDGFLYGDDDSDDMLNFIQRRTRGNFRRIRSQERYADYLVNAPATSQFASRPYIDWFAVGLPVSIDRPPRGGEPAAVAVKVRILHSPSSPVAKGSLAIEKAIGNLIAKGHPIDFVRLIGVPNAAVLEELSRCDFTVDQLYSDTPMAAFAAEAAAMGVPSVVAGYFAKDIASQIDPQDLPPSLYVLPDAIEDAIERMIVDPGFRRDLGRRARQFVETQWSPEKVAANYLRMLTDDVPKQWVRSPCDNQYFEGGGVAKENLRRTVRAFIDKFGTGMLCLDDKPVLKRKLISFARAP
jgi:glycosyltransferase involved in cell wall biosynthesis